MMMINQAPVEAYQCQSDQSIPDVIFAKLNHFFLGQLYFFWDKFSDREKNEYYERWFIFIRSQENN